MQNSLEEFAKKSQIDRQFSDDLKAILQDISSKGTTDLPWSLLSEFFSWRITDVLKTSAEKFSDCPATGEDSCAILTERLLELLKDFEGAPFTIQRLCEILLDPERHYRSTRKLAGALDKLLTVSSLASDDLAASFVVEEAAAPLPLPNAFAGPVDMSFQTHWPLTQPNDNVDVTMDDAE